MVTGKGRKTKVMEVVATSANGKHWNWEIGGTRFAFNEQKQILVLGEEGWRIVCPASCVRVAVAYTLGCCTGMLSMKRGVTLW